MRLSIGSVLVGALALTAIPMAPRALADVPTPEPSNHRAAQTLVHRSGPSLSELLTDPSELHPRVLDSVTMSADQLGSHGRTLIALRQDIERNQNLRAWAEAERARRTTTVAAARRAVARARSEVRQAESELVAKQRNLTTLSIDAFMTGSDQPDLTALLDAHRTNAPTRATEELRDTHLGRAAIEDLTDQRNTARRDLERSELNLGSVRRRLEREHNLLAEADTVLEDSTDALARLEPELLPAQRRFERSLLTRLVPGEEHLTFVAINAYYVATETAASKWPQCR
ncbi:MAG: hypothetical protein HKN24_13555, partial [Acidimicrobiales bacterium]|nr:hypothetical protein [Acidimicrobiales bacterium]